jgi:hypothetical protein
VSEADPHHETTVAPTRSRGWSGCSPAARCWVALLYVLRADKGPGEVALAVACLSRLLTLQYFYFAGETAEHHRDDRPSQRQRDQRPTVVVHAGDVRTTRDRAPVRQVTSRRLHARLAIAAPIAHGAPCLVERQVFRGPKICRNQVVSGGNQVGVGASLSPGVPTMPTF